MSTNIKSIGKLLSEYCPDQRDAIHVPIMVVVAGENLAKGSRLRLKFGTENTVLDGEYNEDYIGIADPFLEDYYIEEGTKFWLFLRPGIINDLQHVWSCPQIDNKYNNLNEHELWLRKFAEKWNFNYDEMITEIEDEECYMIARGVDLHSAKELDEGEEVLFWYHMEKLKGKKLNRENIVWACTC